MERLRGCVGALRWKGRGLEEKKEGQVVEEELEEKKEGGGRPSAGCLTGWGSSWGTGMVGPSRTSPPPPPPPHKV